MSGIFTINPHGTAKDGGKVLPLNRIWEQCDHITLCHTTHEKASGGNCPVHGGDACLSEYVSVPALLLAQEQWAETVFSR